MVAALLSVAVYDYNAAVLIHLHGVLVMVLGLVLLHYVAMRRLNATMLITPQIQADIQPGGLSLIIERKECNTSDYCYLYDEFFHGLCFLCVFVPGFMPRTLSKRIRKEFLFEAFNIFSKCIYLSKHGTFLPRRRGRRSRKSRFNAP